VAVGRQHQPGFFEAILGPESSSLSFISRKHFELHPVQGQACFELTNYSQNLILVDSQKVQKGQKATLQLSKSIDFMCMGEAGPMVFLQMVLEPAGAQTQQHQEPPDVRHLARTAPVAPVPQTIHADGPDERTPTRGASSQSISSAAPQASEAASPKEQSGQFWLELTGTALRADFPGSLRLNCPKAGITIGRANQGQQLLEALKEGVFQFLSREHFRIETNVMDGHFQFVALSSNPVWLVHPGPGEPLPIAPGDQIKMYTGSSDLSYDGPGSHGTLCWHFLDEKGLASSAVSNALGVIAPGASAAAAAASLQREPTARLEQPKTVLVPPGSQREKSRERVGFIETQEDIIELPEVPRPALALRTEVELNATPASAPRAKAKSRHAPPAGPLGPALTPVAQKQAGAGMLHAPVPGLSFSEENEASSPVSIDLDSPQHDGFAASGFRHH